MRERRKDAEAFGGSRSRGGRGIIEGVDGLTVVSGTLKPAPNEARRGARAEPRHGATNNNMRQATIAVTPTHPHAHTLALLAQLEALPVQSCPVLSWALCLDRLLLLPSPCALFSCRSPPSLFYLTSVRQFNHCSFPSAPPRPPPPPRPSTPPSRRTVISYSTRANTATAGGSVMQHWPAGTAGHLCWKWLAGHIDVESRWVTSGIASMRIGIAPPLRFSLHPPPPVTVCACASPERHPRSTAGVKLEVLSTFVDSQLQLDCNSTATRASLQGTLVSFLDSFFFSPFSSCTPTSPLY